MRWRRICHGLPVDPGRIKRVRGTAAATRFSANSRRGDASQLSIKGYPYYLSKIFQSRVMARASCHHPAVIKIS
jgi:hypothetical protein